jgi:glycerol uptake facilitator-like aquaporin
MNQRSLWSLRALAAEAIGTTSLLAIVVGSGIMGERLSGGNVAIALLANALATGCGLYVLISVFAPLSGAHFNPVVSLISAVDRAISWRICVSYIAVQIIAAILGVLLAHAMFDEPLLQLGTHRRTGVAQWISECVATMGLIVTIRGSETRGPTAVAAAVGCYISAAYWFTSSTSFANPAVTIARAFTTTFAGIAPSDVAAFIAAQLVGACSAVVLSRRLFDAMRQA